MDFEANLIEQLRKNNSFIGDDCAVFDKFVISTDSLVQNIHFSLDYSSNFQIGYKSAAVSLSDVAAMGAKPKYILLSISLPKDKTNFAKGFLEGFNSCINKFNVTLIGGDTTGSNNTIFINTTAIGTIIDKPIFRKGAKQGDTIYITKIPGLSHLGLKLLQTNKIQLHENAVKTHLMPEPEVNKALIIAKNKLANSMQDLSDGISKDLKTLCTENNCGAIINLDLLPVPKCKTFTELELLNIALHGGEDYSLLFTSNKSTKTITALLDKVYPIGKITSDRDIVVADKEEKKTLSNLTYKHF